MFSSSLIAQEWTVTEMGIWPNDKTYGVCVGNVHNDDIERVYATTGVLSAQEVNAQILYNSIASTISVLNKTGQTGKIGVYDLSGKMIMNEEVNDKHQTYALGNLTQGIYLINLTIGSRVKNKKIFVN